MVYLYKTVIFTVKTNTYGNDGTVYVTYHADVPTFVYSFAHIKHTKTVANSLNHNHGPVMYGRITAQKQQTAHNICHLRTRLEHRDLQIILPLPFGFIHLLTPIPLTPSIALHFVSPSPPPPPAAPLHAQRKMAHVKTQMRQQQQQRKKNNTKALMSNYIKVR